MRPEGMGQRRKRKRGRGQRFSEILETRVDKVAKYTMEDAYRSDSSEEDIEWGKVPSVRTG